MSEAISYALNDAQKLPDTIEVVARLLYTKFFQASELSTVFNGVSSNRWVKKGLKYVNMNKKYNTFLGVPYKYSCHFLQTPPFFNYK